METHIATLTTTNDGESNRLAFLNDGHGETTEGELVNSTQWYLKLQQQHGYVTEAHGGVTESGPAANHISAISQLQHAEHAASYPTSAETTPRCSS
jgi:hypothetical protein